MQRLFFAGVEVTYLRPYSKPAVHNGRHYPGYSEVALVRPALYDAQAVVSRVRNDRIRLVTTWDSTTIAAVAGDEVSA